MQRWLKFGVLVLLLALLCVSGNVRAQDGTSDTVQIMAERTNENTSNFDELFQSVSANLAANNIQISLIPEVSTNASEVSPNVYISMANDDDIWSVSIQALTPESLELSPILISQSETPLEITSTSKFSELETELSNIVTGISLYSIDRCDLATSYFDLSESTREVIISWDVTAYVNFYKGNCSLITSQFETAADNFIPALALSDGVSAHTSASINLVWALLQRQEGEVWESESDILLNLDWAFDIMSHSVDLYLQYGDGPKSIDLLSRRAQLYALDFRYDDAIADMDAAIELDSTNPELHVLRGNITLLIYEWDRVLDDYNTAMERDPDYADAYFFRAVFFYTRTEYTMALDDFAHYLELAPDGEHATDAATYIDEIEQLNAAQGD